MRPRHLRPVPSSREPAPIIGAEAAPDPTIPVHEPENIGRWPAELPLGGEYFARLLEWRVWTVRSATFERPTYTAHASYAAALDAARAAALDPQTSTVHVVALVQQHVWIDHTDAGTLRARMSRRLAEWPPDAIQAASLAQYADLPRVLADVAARRGPPKATEPRPALRGLAELIHRATAAHAAYTAARKRPE